MTVEEGEDGSSGGGNSNQSSCDQTSSKSHTDHADNAEFRHVVVELRLQLGCRGVMFEFESCYNHRTTLLVHCGHNIQIGRLFRSTWTRVLSRSRPLLAEVPRPPRPHPCFSCMIVALYHVYIAPDNIYLVELKCTM